jgi:hypothetical protein
VSKLREALAAAFVEEVGRVLKTMSVRGWTFDQPTNINMTVTDATPIRFLIEAHIDECSHTFTINAKTKEDDLARAVERLVVDWFASHRHNRVHAAQ